MKYDIEKDTPILPWVIADGVIEEVMSLLLVDEHYNLADSLYLMKDVISNHLVKRQEDCYESSEHWRKLMKGRGNSGRDTLYSFMRHWLSGYLKKEMPDIFVLIPKSYHIGISL